METNRGIKNPKMTFLMMFSEEKIDRFDPIWVFNEIVQKSKIYG